MRPDIPINEVRNEERLRERARIVRWLKNEEKEFRKLGATEAACVYGVAADSINSGVHEEKS